MTYLPSIQSLQAFEAAARWLSFVQAAHELNVTPGAISRRLTSLEELLGARLFRRYHRRVELTPAGREYLNVVSELLARLAQAGNRLREREPSRSLSVCVYPTFAFRWLIPRWAKFHDAFPDIEVQLTTSLNPVDFARDQYDLVIKVSDGLDASKRVVQEKLCDVLLYPVCAPAMASSLRNPVDLSRHTLLHGDPRPDDWQRWLQTAGVSELVDSQAGLHFDSTNLAIQAAIEGLGIAIGIDALIRDDLAQGLLVRPFGPVRQSSNPFVIAYPPAKQDNMALLRFRDWLLAEVDAMGAGPGEANFAD